MRLNLLGKLKTKTARNYCLGAVILVAVFVLGTAVGSGRLQISHKWHNETSLPSSLDYSSVNNVYKSLRENYDGKLTESQVLDGLKHGLAESTGDPYTVYFTPSESKAFNTELDPTITGIGAQLDLDAQGNAIIVSPIDGSPAAAAGLRAKDIIATVNDKSTAGMSLDKVVSIVRGPKGSTVTLGIVRGQQALNIKIARDTISVPTVTSKILDGNVGYLQVSQFSNNTFSLAQKAALSFQQAGVKKVVLDLRNNPGGEVDAAVNISSLWLPSNKLIMQEKRGSTVVDQYKSTGNDLLNGIPTVVLVNAGSASAAEITAAALHDNGAATVMGEKSFGKGVVQQLLPFADGSSLKVTIASWYRPNGQDLNHKGITPDKVVKMTDEDYKNGTDPQLIAAEAYLTSH
ncbi:MAG: S41 family peptidase [Candidatus Saccharimonadales bacterium]